MKDKIKVWVKEHHLLVIVCLLVIIMFKGCKSCSSERRFDYQLSNYEHVIDSMQTVIDNGSISNKDLYDSINSLKSENNMLKDVIKDIRDDKEYYKKQNRNLTNVAENLSKKENDIK